MNFICKYRLYQGRVAGQFAKSRLFEGLADRSSDYDRFRRQPSATDYLPVKIDGNHVFISASPLN